MTVKTASPNNAEAIRRIYDYYVNNTCVTFDLTTPSADEFRHRIENTLKQYPYIICEENGAVVGYAYASPFKARAAYDWSAEISIYAAHGMTGRNFGTALYTELEKRLEKMGIQNIYACITHPNMQSENFHEKMGFKKTAHFSKCGYKHEKWLDVIWMEKFIGEHPAYPSEVFDIPDTE